MKNNKKQNLGGSHARRLFGYLWHEWIGERWRPIAPAFARPNPAEWSGKSAARAPAGRRHRGMSSPRGLASATNGVLPAPGFRDRGFGDCRCRLGRPVAYFDGTLKVFQEPYLPAIRNASVEPLPDRPGPRAQFERRRDEFLPRDLTLLHAAARYTM